MVESNSISNIMDSMLQTQA